MDLKEALAHAELRCEQAVGVGKLRLPQLQVAFVFPSKEYPHLWDVAGIPPIPTCFGYTYFRVVGSDWQLVRRDS